MSILFLLFAWAGFSIFAARRLLRYLHIFQQEEYNPDRFLRWIWKSRSYDKRLSFVLLLTGLVAARGAFSQGGIEPFLLILFALFGFLESDPRKVAKKKLVMTFRAKRIFLVAFVLCLAVGFAAAKSGNPLWWIVAVHFVPFALALTDVFLKPFETRVQKRITKEASAILAQTNPMVIGITGSFGKTSVKHILGHILGVNAPTLFTPGSVNTLMGISRVIRENLNVRVRFFLVEMGAYGIGSIRNLCLLTPPKLGIVTALGEAHYERFGSLKAVAQAKFELASAVLSNDDGKMIVHESVLEQEYASDFVERHRDRFIVCGRGADADLKIGDIGQSPSGIAVKVLWKDKEFDLFSPIFGLAHAQNMAMAFVAAIICGVDPERAKAALRTVPQISHRLEVKRLADGTTYIDDAYNSNPKGFSAALDLLSLIGAEKGGRRILITPGIVELGNKNWDIHEELGRKAAACADILVVIRSDRIPSLADGFSAIAPEKQVVMVDSFDEARAWMSQNLQAPDVYLIENDLTDVDESGMEI